MHRYLIALVVSATIAAVPSTAQTIRVPAGVTPGGIETPAGAGNSNDMAVNQIKRFGNYDALQARLKQSNNKGKTAADLIAEDKANAVALVAASKLSCTVSDAILVAEDAAAHTTTYEVACEKGPGYFLVQREPPAAPSGFSCFAADAAREADVAAHRQPATACGLPANASSKKVAESILSNVGKVCAAKALKWRGQSATTDFLEVACEDGTGFIIRSPLPGSQAPVRISTCIESGQAGLACRLTESDPEVAAAKAALQEHGIVCDPEKVRIIGHEAIKKRRVVEFACPKEQPNGLVAFIPVEGSTAPFETFDCRAAKQRQAVCTLTQQN